MTEKEHKEKHKALHNSFDELLADWIAQTKKTPSKSTILDLINWSHEQTINPTEVTP